jgi:hypothetical protein
MHASPGLSRLSRRALAAMVLAALGGTVAAGSRGTDGSALAGSSTVPQERVRPSALPPWTRRHHGPLAVVANCDDAGPGSLRRTIALAAEGAVVDLTQLPCSTITLSSGAIEVGQRDLSLLGPGPDALAIDAAGLARVFELTGEHAADSGIVIEGIAMSGGVAEWAGGCVIATGNLTLRTARVRDCLAEGAGPAAAALGGGVVAGGKLALIDSTITGNVAKADGAAHGGGVASLSEFYGHSSVVENNRAWSDSGVAAGGGVATIRITAFGLTVTGNRAHARHGPALGGGVFAEGREELPSGERSVELHDSRVEGNRAQGGDGPAHGGGIQAGNPALPTRGYAVLFRSTLRNNRVESACVGCTSSGGAINVHGGIGLDGTLVRDNAVLVDGLSGTALGGGVASYPPADPPAQIFMAQSTFSGNRALAPLGSAFAGAAAPAGGSLAGQGVTIAFNEASTAGGGILTGTEFTSLSSSIVARNSAPLGADIGAGGSAGPARVVGGSNSLVMEADPDVALPADALRDDPRLLPLANNGGSTFTHALLADSPAIDAGLPLGRFNDQRGHPWLRVHGAAADIGAFELQPDSDRIFTNDFDR